MKRLLVTACLLVSSIATANDRVKAPEISLEEFKKVVETHQATIIDANGSKTYKDGHIPGALSFAAHEKDVASILPKDKSAPIVAYCGGPLCTAWEDAAKAAQSLGYTNIKHFKGGIKGWKDSGQKVETGS